MNILTEEGATQFGKAMEQLKMSLEGLISITENMIPERLFSANFKDYFTSLCANAGDKNSIQINVSYSGEFENLGDVYKTKIYLVVQSLLNFLVNHTQPTQVDLSFIRSENSLAIRVSDDGKKYDLPVLANPGIKESENIRTMTESMNGIFTILDSQKEGNKLRITFND